ncbi:MAG TPA: Rab family GTPase [Spirochaetales bacterium]|nr:Rab family GTPase [Spirochaetales bacterium]HPG85894.1 Rab family GTPase [Spirochaetales bacterium]
MIKKKLCLLGSLGVGKTSLIRKFVLNVYSETYLCTVGVKVDKKIVRLRDGEDVILMIWDMEGQDDFSSLADTYLRGLSGYLCVADGTRPETLRTALSICSSMNSMFQGVSSSLLVNKCDLTDRWAVTEEECHDLAPGCGRILRTSAKLGIGVEEAFVDIAGRMVERPHG